MTHEKFVETVHRLEDFARREPGRYQFRVALLAALGYAYPLLIVGVILALLGGIVYLTTLGGRFHAGLIKVVILLGGFALFVARSLWVKVEPPDGEEVTREEAPRLFALADELTAALKTPRIDHVLVNGEFNAALAQVPRLGPLGFYRNYMVVGLPLSHALTPEQFRAVVAHEVGHMSGRQGRFAAWIYRVRRTWAELLERFEREERRGAWLFEWFVKWYAPFFNAYSFVLARRHEYEADAASARLTGAETAAEALVAVRAGAGFLEEKFWPEVFRAADDEPKPPRGVLRRLAGALKSPPGESDVETRLRAALKEETGYDDTHPSLPARLAALGFEGEARDRAVADWVRRQAAPRGESAAEHYLGGVHERLAERFEALWADWVGKQWRERHEYAREARAKLAALEERAAREPLNAEETWERASLTADFRGPDAAVPLVREVLERDPAHVQANFVLGEFLLGREDESGIEHIQRAVDKQPLAAEPAFQVIHGFYMRQGRRDEAEAYRRKMTHHFEELEAAGRERQNFKDGEGILPHGLGPQEVARLAQQLARIEGLKAAYLARKRLAHFPDEAQVYVLGVVSASPWYKSSGDADARLLQDIVKLADLPPQSFVVLLKVYKQTDRAMRQTEGALIYER